MWRDRWFALGVVGAMLSCLACVTPAAVFALAVIGLSAWRGHVDTAVALLLVGFAALAVYRYWTFRKAAP
jgi:hypothetical protein